MATSIDNNSEKSTDLPLHDDVSMMLMISEAKRDVAARNVELGEFRVQEAEMNLAILQMQLEEQNKEHACHCSIKEDRVEQNSNYYAKSPNKSREKLQDKHKLENHPLSVVCVSNKVYITKTAISSGIEATDTSICKLCDVDTSFELTIAIAKREVIEKKIELAEYRVTNAEQHATTLEEMLKHYKIKFPFINKTVQDQSSVKDSSSENTEKCFCSSAETIAKSYDNLRQTCNHWSHDLIEEIVY